jgi:hypothetical protein
MCVLCGDLIGEPHWTERSVKADAIGSVAGESDRRQARFRRTRILNRVLRVNKLTVHEDLSGTLYVLGNGKGSQEVVQHLGQVWPAADRLAGRRLDPLDAGLLTALEAGER